MTQPANNHNETPGLQNEAWGLEDLIGQNVIKLVEVEKEILNLNGNSGFVSQELNEARTLKLHELRMERNQLRMNLARLKVQQKRHYLNRLSAINMELDHAHSQRLDVAELKALSRECEHKIIAIEQEIKSYTA